MIERVGKFVSLRFQKGCLQDAFIKECFPFKLFAFSPSRTMANSVLILLLKMVVGISCGVWFHLCLIFGISCNEFE